MTATRLPVCVCVCVYAYLLATECIEAQETTAALTILHSHWGAVSALLQSVVTLRPIRSPFLVPVSGQRLALSIGPA
jgi:hypothetical protein